LKETAIKLLFIGHVSTGHLNSFILSHFLYTCDHAHTHVHTHTRTQSCSCTCAAV